MSAEVFIYPTEDAPPLTVEQIRNHFDSVGMSSRVERDAELTWLVLEQDGGYGIRFTVNQNGQATSAVLEHSSNDVSLLPDVERAFEAMGWTTGDEEC